ncbi:MAG TPA: hypothetical protein VGO07_01155 [Candidatus Saccharimonadales bacterium]|nr:hypothetical protein [Candidatus Saccharimonadales bacterium]
MRHNRSRTLAIGVLAVVIAIAASLHAGAAIAATYYVSPHGNDSNAGTSTSAPFLTIQQAASRSRSCDTINVLDGTYAAFSITHSGSSGCYITFRAYPGSHPIVKKTGSTWNAIDLSAATPPSYIVIDGFTIVGNAQSITAAQAQSAADYNSTTNGNCIGAGTGSHHVTVRNSNISYCPGAGIILPGDYITINNNVIHHNSFWSPIATSGVTISGKDVDSSTGTKIFVYNNVFYANQNFICNKFQTTPCRITDGEGIIVDSNKAKAYHGRILIYNNIAYSNGGPGILSYLSQHVDVANNTTYHNNVSASEPAKFYGHVAGGEIAISSSNDARVFNNVMYGSSGVTVVYAAMASSSTNVTWDYNLLFNGTDKAAVGAHDLRADPKFVSASSFNFHLQSNSPAKFTGTTTLAPKVDFDGVSRPSGSISRSAYQ